MIRKEISKVVENKLQKWFTMTLDTNNDGLVNWSDFEVAIEKIVSVDEAKKSGRLQILRKRVQQHYLKYFWDLCDVGDANKDGNIDLEEWLDVMNDVIRDLKNTKEFPEWYEGLHKALWRSQEFLDNHNVLKEEFVNMLDIWCVGKEQAEQAYDFITEHGKKKMDYALFNEFMKKFLLTDIPGHPINMNLDKNF